MVARVGLVIASLLTGAAVSLLVAQHLAPTPEIRIAGPNGESLTDAGMFEDLTQMKDKPRQPVVIQMQSEPLRIDASSLKSLMSGKGLNGRVEVKLSADPIEIPPLDGNVRIGIGLDGGSTGGLLDALFANGLPDASAVGGASPEPAPEVVSGVFEAPAWMDAFADRRGLSLGEPVASGDCQRGLCTMRSGSAGHGMSRSSFTP